MLFLKKNSEMPEFMIFPKKIMYNRNLSDYAKLIYVHLLDRARLSMTNAEKGWEDENGDIFIVYPLEDIAAVTGREVTSVKRAMKQLQDEELIFRKHSGRGLANHIYISDIKEKIKVSDSAKTPCQKAKDSEEKTRECENAPCESAKTPIQTVRKSTPNNNYINNNYVSNNKICDFILSDKSASPEKTEETVGFNRFYGKYKNVRLNDSEIYNLQATINNPQQYVDRLSERIYNNEKVYDDHFLEVIMMAKIGS